MCILLEISFLRPVPELLPAQVPFESTLSFLAMVLHSMCLVTASIDATLRLTILLRDLHILMRCDGISSMPLLLLLVVARMS